MLLPAQPPAPLPELGCWPQGSPRAGLLLLVCGVQAQDTVLGQEHCHLRDHHRKPGWTLSSYLVEVKARCGIPEVRYHYGINHIEDTIVRLYVTVRVRAVVQNG